MELLSAVACSMKKTHELRLNHAVVILLMAPESVFDPIFNYR
jgi:hypothetical protein